MLDLINEIRNQAGNVYQRFGVEVKRIHITQAGLKDHVRARHILGGEWELWVHPDDWVEWNTGEEALKFKDQFSTPYTDLTGDYATAIQGIPVWINDNALERIKELQPTKKPTWLSLRVRGERAPVINAVEVIDKDGNVLGELARVTNIKYAQAAHGMGKLTVNLIVSNVDIQA